MSRFWERVSWLAAGRSREAEVAFDWIRGRVGSRQNPDGMRSLLHAGISLALLCAGVDLLILWRTHWRAWEIFAFLHCAWVSGLLLGTVLNVGFLETVGGRSLRSLGVPNTITLLRGFLVPTLVYVLAERDVAAGLVLYAAVTGSDAVDGWWARHRGPRTKLGVILDPVIDAFLHLGVFVTLGWVGLLGRTALVLILIRSAILFGGTAFLYLWRGQVRIHSTPFGKATGLLLALTTALLLGLGTFAPGQAVSLERFARDLVTVILAFSVLHAGVVGVINLMRAAPTGGDSAAGGASRGPREDAAPARREP